MGIYGGRIDDARRKTLTCMCCAKVVKGGGIRRMKMHLAGKKGDVGLCKKVPSDARKLC